MANIRDRIERWFESLAYKIYNNKYKTLVIMILIIAGILSQLPKLTVDISNEGFLHKNDQSLIDYNAFRDQFGRDELILIAINSPDVFDQQFLGKLKSLHNELKENVPYIDEINSLINARNTRGEADRLIVEDLLENWPDTDEKIEKTRKRALENPIYKNILISENSKITTIMIQTQTYSSIGNEIDVMDGFEEDTNQESTNQKKSAEKKYLTNEENSKAVNAVHEITKKYDAPDFKIYITGSAAISHFQKSNMKKDMQTFIKFAFLAIILFLFIMFRKISGVVLPLVIILLSFLSTFSVMAAFGAPIKLPTQILPSLLLAVSVGYSVHLLSIFYHHYRSNNKEDSIAYSLGHSGLAIVLTAATTAGGLFSISTSDVAPIADLGIFGGIGVLLAMIYTIILIPVLLSILPIKSSKSRGEEIENTIVDRLLTKVGTISTEHPILTLSISFIIITLSISFIPKIKFSHDVLRWFPEDNPIRIATEKINKEMRGTVNISAIIDTGKENGLYDPDLLKRLDETTAYLETLEVDAIFVGKAWSITTILKESNKALNENRKKFYAIPDDKRLIAQELLLFENSGSDDMEDFIDSQFSKANLIIKIPFEDAVAYTNFLKIIKEHFQENYPDVKVTITGMGEIMFKTKVNAANSMMKSYIYALITITILMMFLIGKLRIGLLSMIPNLSPIVITLGIMGFFNIQMTLFTMLVANIAIGLAVDDTIHFMHNFRRYFEQSGDAKLAVNKTLHTAGRAMLITSCVLSTGFFIFAFAKMSNVVNFGLLTGITIVLALLADYFISPALMVVVNKGKQKA